MLIPNSQVLQGLFWGKQNHREVALPAPGPTAKQQQLQTLNPGLLDFKAYRSEG